MAIVINPRVLIENYLKSQGYLPFSSNNSVEAIHHAILEGAAREMKPFSNVNMNEQGYCWDISVTKTDSVFSAFGEAVEQLELELLPSTFPWEKEKLLIEKIMETL